MKKFKPVITLIAVVVTVGALSITAFASTLNRSPAKVVAEITGRTVENVVAEKIEKNVTYGTIAKDAGKLEEFKEKVLEAKKEILKEKVANKDMTQENADKIIAAIEKNQATCDGSGSERIGKSLGAGQRNGDGTGQGNGQGAGQGNVGLRDGSCGNNQ